MYGFFFLVFFLAIQDDFKLINLEIGNLRQMKSEDENQKRSKDESQRSSGE